MNRSGALRLVVGGVAVVVLWVVAAWWVVAVHPLTGPVVVTLTETNGVHVGDLPALGLGAISLEVWRRRRGRRSG